jgi:arsenate reductase
MQDGLEIPSGLMASTRSAATPSSQFAEPHLQKRPGQRLPFAHRRAATRIAVRAKPLAVDATAATLDEEARDGMGKQRVLFLCTHNSARSQMAEGLLRHVGGDRFAVFSAGTEATRVRPLAIRAMAELGIDISGQQSKTLHRFLAETFDAVITVCDEANETCPVFFGARERWHWSFPDPSKATGSEEEQLAAYRAVRDGLRERIEQELLIRQ